MTIQSTRPKSRARVAVAAPDTEAERRAFLDQAIQALRREVPEALEWLFHGDPPSLRWQGDPDPVDPRLARGWLVLADQRQDPDPSDEQVRQASLLDAESRASLAIWLLRTWITFDTTLAPALTDARRQELRAMAEKAAAIAKRFGRGGTDPGERYQQLIAQESSHEPATAWPHRGLLALVAACSDPDTLDTLRPIVAQYQDAWGAERPRRSRLLGTIG